jgi:hypothetical protein
MHPGRSLRGGVANCTRACEARSRRSRRERAREASPTLAATPAPRRTPSARPGGTSIRPGGAARRGSRRRAAGLRRGKSAKADFVSAAPSLGASPCPPWWIAWSASSACVAGGVTKCTTSGRHRGYIDSRSSKTGASRFRTARSSPGPPWDQRRRPPPRCPGTRWRPRGGAPSCRSRQAHFQLFTHRLRSPRLPESRIPSRRSPAPRTASRILGQEASKTAPLPLWTPGGMSAATMQRGPGAPGERRGCHQLRRGRDKMVESPEIRTGNPPPRYALTIALRSGIYQ